MMNVPLPTGTILLVIFDFDGVLTDNRVIVNEDGGEAVICNRSDGLGFDALRAAGLRPMIMSTERNQVVTKRAEKLKISVLQSVKDKGAAVIEYCNANKIPLDRVMFVGNDVNDLPALRVVGWPVAVQDAHEEVLGCARIVLNSRGGDGAAREIAERILGLSFV